MAAAAKKPRPQLVRAELVKRYRLLLVDETGAVVAKLPEIPAGVVTYVAAKLREVLPVLVDAAKYRDTVVNVARMFGDLTGGGRRGKG